MPLDQRRCGWLGTLRSRGLRRGTRECGRSERKKRAEEVYQLQNGVDDGGGDDGGDDDGNNDGGDGGGDGDGVDGGGDDGDGDGV